MRLFLIAAAATLIVAPAAPAAAQSWYGANTGRGHAYSSGWNVQAQYDRPGDYRCDAFWDASRTDCGARWRDQRHRTSYAAYGYNAGYGHDDRYGGRYGYDTRYGSRRRGRDRDYGYNNGGAAWYGAYGRPDLVYGGGGRASSGRDGRRIDWCRATYRSYDPNSGYYRAYSGRLVWCG